MVKYSIVIPIYNAQRFITRCVDTLLVQVTDEFEIILVDDGSTDDSAALCDALQEDYPSIIHALHSKNEGAFLARLKGVKQAKGEYVCFLDADDFWEPDSASRIKKLAEKYPVDIILFGYHEIAETEKSLTTIIPPFPEGLGEYKSGISSFRSKLLEDDRMNSLWTKVIRRELFDFSYLEQDSFAHLSYAEDLLQLLFLTEHIKSYYVSHQILYNYVKNTQSTTLSGITPKSLYSLLAVYEEYWSCAKRWRGSLEVARKRLVVPIKHGLYALMYTQSCFKQEITNILFQETYRNICKVADISDLKFQYRIACSMMRANKKNSFVWFVWVFNQVRKLKHTEGKKS